MYRLNTIEELTAVVKGGHKFLNDSFRKRKIPCHPIAEVTFFPSDTPFSKNFERGMNRGFVLLYSNDGESWSSNFPETLRNAEENFGTFYITDWYFNTFMQTEYYMWDEIKDLVLPKFDDITLINGYKWKESELGSVEFYEIEEYFS